MESIQQEDSIFESVYKSDGKSKNKTGKISIETSTRGLVYRTNVYLNDFLIDAKEVSCIDLATLENGQSVFKDRYLATHSAFESQYFLDKIYIKVLSDEGNYSEGDGKCIVNTYVFENLVKNEVVVDDYEVDVAESEIEDKIVNDKKAFKLKYTKLHKDFVKDNIDIPKFPVNTFLNKTLKKFPLYDRNPMYAFYIFLATVMFVLWIISLVVCGRALPKIVKKIGGKEASLVVRDMQKSMCIRGKKEVKSEKKELLHETLYKDGYLILPQKLVFSENRYIKTIHIKNTMDGDLIVKLNNKVIDKFDSPLVTPEMVINVLTPKSVVIKPDGIGLFEFKIEDSFLQDSSVAEGSYTGRLVFDVTKVKYNKTENKSISFTFNVVKKDKPKENKSEE